jgi:hypothetical protein
MAWNQDNVKSQAIALLNLAPRDTAGVPTYTASVAGGDTVYAQEEIDRAATSATVEIIRTILETAGHPHRTLWTQPEPLLHADVLPPHYGPIGTPRITPFQGCPYSINGKVKSIEEIAAYRANPGGYYSATEHDDEVMGSGGDPTGRHSKLAGFYAVDEAAQVIHFTGYAAESDLAWFQADVAADYASLPDDYYDLAICLTISKLRKDGDATDIFSHYEAMAREGLNQIRAKQSFQPSLKPTVGARDSGAK